MQNESSQTIIPCDAKYCKRRITISRCIIINLENNTVVRFCSPTCMNNTVPRKVLQQKASDESARNKLEGERRRAMSAWSHMHQSRQLGGRVLRHGEIRSETIERSIDESRSRTVEPEYEPHCVTGIQRIPERDPRPKKVVDEQG